MSQITFFAPDTDAFVSSVMTHVPEYEQSTGDTVRLRIIDSDTYFSNDIHAQLGEDDGADVFMSGPVLAWEHLAAGFVEPLDDYLPRARDDYDFSDFLPNLIVPNTWSGAFGTPLGDGPLLGIPVNCESYNLAYDRDRLETLGLDVPRTWAEYFDAARLIARSGVQRGFAQRGEQVWHTMYTGFASQFWSEGARDFDADGHSAIATPVAVQATTRFLDALHDAGPRDWTNQRWYELAMDFCAGDYGLIVDSDHYVAFFEDATNSSMAGRVGYAMPPAGATGEVTPSLWTWSLVMNARSRRKDAAWRFMQWASSREFLLRAVFEGNMNPTRTSVWDNERFGEFSSGWGDFVTVSRRLAEKTGRVLVTPAPNTRAIADRWVRALRAAYLGEDVEHALRQAASEIDEMVEAL